jgi:hypothetical protein
LGRFDALIALVSGSTLVGFVGLVAYAVLAAVGVFTGGSVSGATGSAYLPDLLPDDGEPTDARPQVSATFERQPAIVGGEAVSYLDFGTQTQIASDGTVAVAPIWVFIDGFDDDGTPILIPDHPTVLDAEVGDAGYSDLWDVQFVVVPPGAASRWIHSLSDLEASDFKTVPAGMLVNCPLVDADATTSEGHPMRTGWVRGEQVFYFDLGVSTAEPGAVYQFVPADDPVLGGYATPAPLDLPPLVVLPDRDGAPTQFFRLYEVEVNDAATATAIRTEADLDAAGLWIRATGDLLNRPLIAD